MLIEFKPKDRGRAWDVNLDNANVAEVRLGGDGVCTLMTHRPLDPQALFAVHCWVVEVQPGG